MRLQETCGADAEFALRHNGRAVPFRFRPFEIKTLRLERGAFCREVNLLTETDEQRQER